MKREFPAKTVDLTVIMVNYNTANLLPQALSDLDRASDGLSVRTVIVDNFSRDGSVEMIERDFPERRLIVNDKNVGFGRANNQALDFIEGRYVLLLNTDAFVAPDSLTKTVAYMDAHPEVGILGVRLVGRDGALQPSARYFPTPWNIFLQRTNLKRWFRRVRLVDDMAWDHASVRACDWVPGCFYLVRREVIETVGLFDPRYFLYYEEVDHCFATRRAGWDVVFYPDTQVVHIGGESAKSDGEITAGSRQLAALRIESELLYFRKNHGLLSAVASVLLTTVGDLILGLRQVVTGRKSGPPLTVLAWTLFFRTWLGSRPTR